MSDRRGGELGFIALELAFGLGVLVLPTLLLVAQLPTWAERRTTAREIAYAVARQATQRAHW